VGDRARPYRLVFTGKQAVECESFDLTPPTPGEVQTRTLCSLMSTGTENIVFNRLFAAGTAWDRWVKYPFYPGYACIAVVEALGEGVTGFAVGDRVAHRGTHASHHVLPAERAVLLGTLAPEQAVWHALAKIAFLGARAAEYGLGDTVLIIGAGPIGQMSLRWAVAAGAVEIIVVDPLAARLTLARQGGATRVFDLPLGELAPQLKSALGGELPRVVIDTTGNGKVFAEALGLARPRGRVVLLGDTGSPDDQHLTSAVVNSGLTIVGVHDRFVDDGWTDVRCRQVFCTLAAAGRFPTNGLISHRFNPRQCREAYAEVNSRRGETMGVIFDWSAR
jgi:2-desacetyl-2-hydroxyethyl bacteriochlorophyllide A dehydrogenase